MKLSFVTFDVFTTTRYAGNPVALILVPRRSTSELLEVKQAIAKEFNLSEIVFLHEPENRDTDVQIDIFTSIAEVPFAGHPTIGSAWYLLQHVRPAASVNSLNTKAGKIPISASSDEPNSLVCASIPHEFHVHAATFPHPMPTTVKACPTVSIVRGMTFILVPMPSIDSLASLTAGLKSIQDVYNPSVLDAGWQTGLIGTLYYAPTGQDATYRTRMFGSREDPATGSASCALACYIATMFKSLGSKPLSLKLIQGVEMGRESHISVQVTRNIPDDRVEEVVLSGAAVTVMEGTLEV